MYEPAMTGRDAAQPISASPFLQNDPHVAMPGGRPLAGHWVVEYTPLGQNPVCGAWVSMSGKSDGAGSSGRLKPNQPEGPVARSSAINRTGLPIHSGGRGRRSEEHTSE